MNIENKYISFAIKALPWIISIAILLFLIIKAPAFLIGMVVGYASCTYKDKLEIFLNKCIKEIDNLQSKEK